MRAGGRWRDLGRVMALGSAYDFVFAVIILGFTRPAARLMGLPVPHDPVYLGLNGVLLALLAALYALAALRPRRYQGVALVSAIGRTVGFAYFAAAWTTAPRPALLALGFGDLAIGLLTGAVWLRARRGRSRH